MSDALLAIWLGATIIACGVFGSCTGVGVGLIVLGVAGMVACLASGEGAE